MNKKQEKETSFSFIESLKKRWMATVDAIIDPLMIVASDYTIIQANKALATHAGIPIKDLVGKTCYGALSKRNTPCNGCTLNKTIQSDKNCSFELELSSAERFFEVSSQPIHTDDSNQTAALMIYRDRTAAKKLQDQLLQSEKLASIGLLAGGIAHEINNPLAGIMIFSQMLLKEMPKDSEFYQDIVEIEAATQRCKAIVANLLDFARQKPAAIKDKEQIDFNKCVESAIKFASMGDALKDITLNKELHTSTVYALGDNNKLVQLILNLLQNAIHAMPKGGNLYVRSKLVESKQQSFVHIEVEDTGIGIPADQIKYIFDPFYTSKQQHIGTGLGLSVCHGIAKDMNAAIHVKSQVNKGSTFTFVMPIEKTMKKGA